MLRLPTTSLQVDEAIQKPPRKNRTGEEDEKDDGCKQYHFVITFNTMKINSYCSLESLGGDSSYERDDATSVNISELRVSPLPASNSVLTLRLRVAGREGG